MKRASVSSPAPPAEADGLDQLTIATPCDVSWDTLAGDGAVRHCGKCRQNVYDLSGFSRIEALQLLEMKEGRLCLRLHRRPDGTIVTADCWARVRAARRRGAIA